MTIKMTTKPNKVYYWLETGNAVKCCVVYDKFYKEYRMKIGLEKPRMTKVVFDNLMDALSFAEESVKEYVNL